MGPHASFTDSQIPDMDGVSEQASPAGTELPSSGSSATSCFRFGVDSSPNCRNTPNGRPFRKVLLRRTTCSPARDLGTTQTGTSTSVGEPTAHTDGHAQPFLNGSVTSADTNPDAGEGSPASTQRDSSINEHTKNCTQSSPGVFVDKTNSLNCGSTPDTTWVPFVFGPTSTTSPLPATPQFKFNAAGSLESSFNHVKQRPPTVKLKRGPFGTPGPAPSPMMWSPADVLDIPCNFSWPSDQQSTVNKPTGPTASSVDNLAEEFAHTVEVSGQTSKTTTASVQQSSFIPGATGNTAKSSSLAQHFVFGVTTNATTSAPNCSQPTQPAAAAFVFGNSTMAPGPLSPSGASISQARAGRPLRAKRSPVARGNPSAGGHPGVPNQWPEFKISQILPGDLPTVVSNSGSEVVHAPSATSSNGPASSPPVGILKFPSAGNAAVSSSGPGTGGGHPVYEADPALAVSELAKLLGDNAYKRGDFSTAIQEYGRAIALIQSARQSHKVMLAVLYSNRAGALLMQKQPRAALQDSKTAMAIDAKCVRAYLRAITCHTRLGDLTSANHVLDVILERCSASSPHFQELLAKQKSLEMLRGVTERVRSGARAAQMPAQDKVPELRNDMAMAMEQMPCSPATMLACAALLLRMGRHTEALKACAPDSETQQADAGLCWMAVQVQYHQGELQAALDQARSLPQLLATPAKECGDAPQQGSTDAAPLPTAAELDQIIAKIEKLLQLKQAGNTAVQAKKYNAAVEHYTAALAEGAPLVFASVLLGNRGAAHQAAGRWTEAIADCGRSKALNPAYAKAYSRLWSLLLEVRRANAAADILQQMLKNTTVATAEQTEAQQRIKQARSKASWQKTPDHYKLLAVESSCPEEDIRKSYRKLALRYHPDKALANCRFEVVLGGCGVASEPQDVVEKRVKDEASWVFNFVNEAHEELSDKQRRSKVDIGLQHDQDPSTLYPRGYGSMFGSSDAGYPWSTGGSYYSPGGGHQTFSRRSAAPPPTYTRTYAGARPASSTAGGQTRGGSSSTQPPPRAAGAQANAGHSKFYSSQWWHQQHDSTESDDEQDDDQY